MLLIYNDNTDPYYNLACEEYLLKNKTDNIFMVWRNKNAVIIGRNQNPQEETDEEYIKAKSIKVVRRLTGGGAVYHDEGNINYTFIQRGAKEHFNDYKYFAAPIIEFLKTVGITAEFSGRNDIITGGGKISGTAQVMVNDDVLFHGTLLIDTDISVMTKCLKPDYTKLERHGIKSVESRVTNLKDVMGGRTVPEIMRLLYNAFKEYKGYKSREYKLTAEDDKAIKGLVESKYGTYEWNYNGNEK
jgi:lipoate-protein ligase A